MRRRVVGTIASIAAAVGMSAAGYASAGITPSDGAVRSPTGCPSLSDVDLVAEADRVETVVPAASAPTVSDHAGAGFDLRGAIEDVRGLSSRFRPVAEFVLASTGMEVTVLSDGPLEVDVDALDRLTRLPLTQPGMFGDTRVAEVQRCYAQRILDGRELAGHSLRILVPADPATCFRGGRLVPLGADAGSCDSAGVTLPQVSVRPQLLGMDLAHARAPATVLVTAATDPARRDPAGVLAGLLLHELHHVTENAFGLPPWSGSLRHYEQRAYYVERAVRRHLRSRGLTLPRPIRFLDVPGDAPGG